MAATSSPTVVWAAAIAGLGGVLLGSLLTFASIKARRKVILDQRNGAGETGFVYNKVWSHKNTTATFIINYSCGRLTFTAQQFTSVGKVSLTRLIQRGNLRVTPLYTHHSGRATSRTGEKECPD